MRTADKLNEVFENSLSDRFVNTNRLGSSKNAFIRLML